MQSSWANGWHNEKSFPLEQTIFIFDFYHRNLLLQSSKCDMLMLTTYNLTRNCDWMEKKKKIRSFAALLPTFFFFYSYIIATSSIEFVLIDKVSVFSCISVEMMLFSFKSKTFSRVITNWTGIFSINILLSVRLSVKMCFRFFRFLCHWGTFGWQHLCQIQILAKYSSPYHIDSSILSHSLAYHLVFISSLKMNFQLWIFHCWRYCFHLFWFHALYTPRCVDIFLIALCRGSKQRSTFMFILLYICIYKSTLMRLFCSIKQNYCFAIHLWLFFGYVTNKNETWNLVLCLNFIYYS